MFIFQAQSSVTKGKWTSACGRADGEDVSMQRDLLKAREMRGKVGVSVITRVQDKNPKELTM
jgi:hypothetical protein